MLRLKATGQGIEVHGRMRKSDLIVLKSIIPSHKRHFDWDRKIWTFDNSCLGHLEIQLELNLSDSLIPPASSVELFTIHYIGSPKQNYNNLCRGMSVKMKQEKWDVIFTEECLRKWFEEGTFGLHSFASKTPKNYYQILGIDESADARQIKKAYRIQAKKYHPDTNKKPKAKEMFIKAKQAYDVLSDGQSQARYNAGLMFERSSNQKPVQDSFGRYSSPQKCGHLLLQGQRRLGLFFVDQILQWNQIKSTDGKILETRWNNNAKKIDKIWR